MQGFCDQLCRVLFFATLLLFLSHCQKPPTTPFDNSADLGGPEEIGGGAPIAGQGGPIVGSSEDRQGNADLYGGGHSGYVVLRQDLEEIHRIARLLTRKPYPHDPMFIGTITVQQNEEMRQRTRSTILGTMDQMIFFLKSQTESRWKTAEEVFEITPTALFRIDSQERSVEVQMKPPRQGDKKILVNDKFLSTDYATTRLRRITIIHELYHEILQIADDDQYVAGFPQKAGTLFHEFGIELVTYGETHNGYEQMILLTQTNANTNIPLLAYYRLGIKNGVRADSSGNLRLATFTNMAGGAPGAIIRDADTSARLHEEKQSRIQSWIPATVATSWPVTLEFWWKIEKYTTVSEFLIGFHPYYFVYRGAHQLGFSYGNNNLYGQARNISNRWTHVVAEFTRREDTNRLFIDGRQRVMGIVEGSVRNIPPPKGLHFEFLGKPDKKQIDFDGSIDEIAIYNGSLDTTEIGRHYTKGSGKAP